MATTANPPPGAVAANAAADPFTSSATQAPPANHRYSIIDTEELTTWSAQSPAAARRALEAHLKDTDRRIQDASRLGTTLLQQRKDLSARLKEVEQVQSENEVPTELREKLVELEREYNEVGRESARAFLPKARAVSDMRLEPTSGATVLTAQARDSPTKHAVPSRRQRNQPTNRIHDIEFATEISTSLLAQVRQLQAALADKDSALKETSSAKAQIESETAALLQRIRHMDETEQKYKDENWNLELRLQELEANYKQSTDKESRLAQALKAVEVEKAAKERELDELKLAHDRMLDDHSMARKVQEADLHGLRRDAALHETEKDKLHSRIEELTAQNTELARAVSYRWNQAAKESDTDFVSAEEGANSDDQTGYHSDPPSPIKGTPARHGMLESETLKSSLHHAHRMIQNLKNNIHREKTEKIELKRMLQDARDELESRRDGGAAAANTAKRRKELEASKFKKPLLPNRLGAARASTTEILTDEPDWEDAEGERTPSKAQAAGVGAASDLVPGHARTMSTDNETDAFETADERNTTTESEAFATGAEDFDEDTEGDLTETEGLSKRNTIRGISTKRGDRSSFLSTASTSGEEGDDVINTPVSTTAQPKYKIRLNRGSKRVSRFGDVGNDSPSMDSPLSSAGTPMGARNMQSLEDELGEMDDESMGGTPVNGRSLADEMLNGTPNTGSLYGSVGYTPSRRSVITTSSAAGTPMSHHANDFDEGEQTVLVHSAPSPLGAQPPAVPRLPMVDAGVMTEPWEITAAEDVAKQEVPDRKETAAGGALAGFGLARLLNRKANNRDKSQQDSAPSTPGREIPEPSAPVPVAAPVIPLTYSGIMIQELEPVEVAQEYVAPLLPRRSSRREGEGSRPGTARSMRNDVFHDLMPGAGNERHSETEGEAAAREPLGELSPNVTLRKTGLHRDAGLPVTKALQIKKQMADEASQTIISSQDIESMLREKTATETAASNVRDAGVSPMTPPRTVATAITTAAPVAVVAARTQTPHRPSSASSNFSRVTISQPPLPVDHSQKIAAATTHAPGLMGPPLMPASAYKPARSRTPMGDRATERGVSRDGATPRASRGKDGRTSTPSAYMESPTQRMSHRGSVSSFASELDDRFNIPRGHILYPGDLEPATDPRMIQAITQTMIGEYLWKYTRKAGRSETSNTRHRRFFWVHPYTRTLYWSEHDPSTAGKNMLKAKSVAIDAVRVIADDNVFPPGLHRKSLVVVTPGREIVFTAPSGQRHETWFNALSYLLLKTEDEKAEGEDGITEEDLDEFRPGFGGTVRRSISRMTGTRSLSRHSQSRASLSSYNSRTTRNTSPQRTEAVNNMLRQSAAAQARTASGAVSPSPIGRESSSSMTHRISSLASRFRTHTDKLGSAGDPAQIYDANVIGESAEDIRAQLERQERNADQLENVRACCDGKHDVGSLARTGRPAFGARFASHSHSHTGDSMKSRT